MTLASHPSLHSSSQRAPNRGQGWLSYLLASVLVLAMLAAWVPVFNVSIHTMPAASPQLLSLARQAPEQPVRIIVQTRDMAQTRTWIQSTGGLVLKELSIIQAVVAEVPAASIQDLAYRPAVRWISLDAPVERSAMPAGRPQPDEGNPVNTFLDTLGVRDLWAEGIDGTGIGVAVIDSGVTGDGDFTSSLTRKSFNPNSTTVNDVYGHGTHVAGIIAGNGTDSNGAYMGVAPGITLISLKISDENGMAYESDTVEAMQWVYENKETYNIRVVNLSINATQEMSYHVSPLDAAAEILWFNGIVVVASAGNYGLDTEFNPISAAPANDPFIITVGASDEQGTTKRKDDYIAPWSAWGDTLDGHEKPDIIAPGKDIISVLSTLSDWDSQYPDRVVLNGEYFRLSGTSMAAPMVTGAVALLLQDEPNLTPDQVKYRLLNTAGSIKLFNSYPYLDVYAAVHGSTTESANTGLEASQLLWTGDDPLTWGSVNWNSVNWNSVNWNSVNWNSVNWNSVNWNSTYFGD